MGDLSEDEEEVAHPPSAGSVARRALALTIVSCRGMLELDSDEFGAESFWDRASAWWRNLGIASELEAWESELLASPFGGADRQLCVNASWRSEALAVLAWALGRADIPPHDQQVNPALVGAALGFLEPSTVLEMPALRPVSELAAYRDVVFTVHWRLTEFRLRPKTMVFADFCKTAWFGPLSLDGIALVAGDLAIRGASIATASPQDVQVTQSIALERHQAANWLNDAKFLLSETRTDT